MSRISGEKKKLLEGNAILTDRIFTHCKNIYEYDKCFRCRFITLWLMVLNNKI